MINQEEIKNSPFLSVGTTTILRELFHPPYAYQLGDSFKPFGGLWGTKYGAINANEWLYYLTTRQSLIEGKFRPEASVITMKDDTRWLIPTSMEEMKDIQNTYPIPIKNCCLVDYHELSKDYDCMFLSRPLIYEDDLKDWSVPSLVIFNLDCIKEYKPIIIDKIDYDYYITLFEVLREDAVKQVQPLDNEYSTIFSMLNELFVKYFKNHYKQITTINHYQYISELNHFFDGFIRENKELFNKIHDIVQNRLAKKGIIDRQTEIATMAQIRNENYDLINEELKRSLKK